MSDEAHENREIRINEWIKGVEMQNEINEQSNQL